MTPQKPTREADMAGGQLPSDALDRLATAEHCELMTRET
jgi:hypothetical protein